MKTRALALALTGLFAQSSLALGQTFETDSELVPSGAPAPTCFEIIDQNNSCLLVGSNVINYGAPRFNLVDLNGAWTDGLYTLYIYIYGEGNPIFVEMSLTNRPDGFGFFTDADTFEVVFPDDDSYVGTLTNPTTITWSNNTVWHKL